MLEAKHIKRSSNRGNRLYFKSDQIIMKLSYTEQEKHYQLPVIHKVVVLLNLRRSALTDQIQSSEGIWKEDMQKTTSAFFKQNRYQENTETILQKAAAKCQLGEKSEQSIS